MKILVVGSGGREHALCWAISKSTQCNALFCAPGNAGIANVADCIKISAEDLDGIDTFVRNNAIDLVVIGPEAPLVLGMADRLRAKGILVVGASAAAAQLEGSKGFMKDILAKYNIPTADYARFSEVEAAKAYIKDKGAPIVVKTDGLAAGKGVTVAMSVDEALHAVDDAMVNATFGSAGAEIVIEEFMQGEELSYFALCDGKTAIPFGSAQDHKAAFDGDKGPNTGGMGAYSPAPVLTPALEQQIIDDIITPTMAGMINEGAPFQGILFAGLMITESGPRLIEYNVRFGDPECQVLMMRLKSDIVDALLASANGTLNTITADWHDEAALNVVMAAKGYPAKYEKNTIIKNVDTAEDAAHTTIFHAGTAMGDAGELLAIGGRVLGVTAIGQTVKQAQARAYTAVDKIDWAEGFCRRDIGWRAIAREEAI